MHLHIFSKMLDTTMTQMSFKYTLHSTIKYANNKLFCEHFSRFFTFKCILNVFRVLFYVFLNFLPISKVIIKIKIYYKYTYCIKIT